MSDLKRLARYLAVAVLALSLLVAGSAVAVAAPIASRPEAGGVIQTDVRYVMALSSVNVRSGPGYNYAIIGRVRSGEVATVTGLSSDRIVNPASRRHRYSVAGD